MSREKLFETQYHELKEAVFRFMIKETNINSLTDEIYSIDEKLHQSIEKFAEEKRKEWKDRQSKGNKEAWAKKKQEKIKEQKDAMPNYLDERDSEW